MRYKLAWICAVLAWYLPVSCRGIPYPFISFIPLVGYMLAIFLCWMEEKKVFPKIVSKSLPIHDIFHFSIQIVPHKAVAEVSKIGNL